jgi:hypothetical protein
MGQAAEGWLLLNRLVQVEPQNVEPVLVRAKVHMQCDRVKMAYDDVEVAKLLSQHKHPELKRISTEIIQVSIRYKTVAAEEIKKGQHVVALYLLDRAVEVYPVDLQLYWQR